MKPRLFTALVVASSIIAFGCQSASDTDTPQDAQAQTPDDPTTQVVEGTLSGFDCAVVGELCPSTHRGGDYTTGVFTDDGAFFFVVNIPNSFLTQYFLERVEVEGTLYAPYDHAVEPEVIHLVEDGQRRLVYEEGYFIDENNRRATFHEGQFRDGRWIVPE